MFFFLFIHISSFSIINSVTIIKTNPRQHKKSFCDFTDSSFKIICCQTAKKLAWWYADFGHIIIVFIYLYKNAMKQNNKMYISSH